MLLLGNTPTEALQRRRGTCSECTDKKERRDLIDEMGKQEDLPLYLGTMLSQDSVRLMVSISQ